MPSAPPLVALRDATLSFGGRPLFAGLDFGIARGEKSCLVGRNGSGKSTLLRALAGQVALDEGSRFLQPSTRIAYLPQDPVFDRDRTVADYVTGGLAPNQDAERGGHRVRAVLKRLDLDGAQPLGRLSGGEGRRAALARALVSEPDVLLLDEPTNHLDLPTIEWLEGELSRFAGALLLVSHDRAFMTRTCRRNHWLDRGRLRSLDKDYSHFEDWAAEVLQAEAEERHRLERRIVREESWLARGVTGRRKRNQGRLARLAALRQSRAEWLAAPGRARLAAAEGGKSGDLVIEAEQLSKSFPPERPGEPARLIVTGFSTRIRRGDRIGIIGPNGAGKTTLVRLLTGELAPDSGRLKLGTRLEALYFDQRRESLDLEATLWENLVPGGGDSVMVGDRQRHVVSYLRDFLFEEHQARQPVRSLSGGERNRLLLARLFARPSNLLILDEPTNDLDMDTLDLLLDVLDDYAGTLLLVSHDRDFLDRLVTGLIVLEGDGKVVEQVGGYSDYLESRRGKAPASRPPAATGPAAAGRQKTASRKLGYREQRELDGLPAEIDALTERTRDLEAKLADPDLYSARPEDFQAAAAELARLREALEAAEARWIALEEKRESLGGVERAS